MLTDMYQITMAYSYWRAGRHNERATFELFFRKCPFKGEYAVFAGLDQALAFIQNFKFTKEDTDYLRTCTSLADCEPEFFDYLNTLDASGVTVEALKEGTLAFPRVTLMSISGPLIVGQLMETTLLNLVNFPSLIATNAARMRLAAGPEKTMLEFGLRRAQGADGGISASRYAYVGGFDGTSNVKAGMLSGIHVSGTHAHAFVQSYTGFKNIKDPTLVRKGTTEAVNLVERVKAIHASTPSASQSNESELAAFTAYAQSFPNGFLALVDTYDTLDSGVENFMIVARALTELGYHPVGIRLDSGDLAYLSKEVRRKLDAAADATGCAQLKQCIVVASNDINEEVLLSLNNQGHAIDAFGIGTHLVTCQAQPALGCVYKLVEIEGEARIKLSQDIAKVMIPGCKKIYRIFNKAGDPILDLLTRATDPAPVAGERILCRHPFQENKRVHVTPSAVVPLLELVWDGPKGLPAAAVCSPSTPDESRAFCKEQLAKMRADIIRPLNPTPYKVSVTDPLYNFLHELWQANMPIPELE